MKMEQPYDEMFDVLYSGIEKRLKERLSIDIEAIEDEYSVTVKGCGIEDEIMFFRNEQEKVKNYLTFPFKIITYSREKFRKHALTNFGYLLEQFSREDWRQEYINHKVQLYYPAELINYLKGRIIEIQTPYKGKRGKRTPQLLWKDTALNKKRLKLLRTLLIEEKFIDKIQLKIFTDHFTGKFPEELINWLIDHEYIFYLFDNLTFCITTAFYQGKHDGKNKTSSANALAAHFKFNGVLKKGKDLYSTKSEANPNKNPEIKNSIDVIINKLKEVKLSNN